MQNQIKIGAVVHSQQGHLFGVVKYFISNLYNSQITHLVVSTNNSLETSKIVAWNKIITITEVDQTVRLVISSEQRLPLPDFVESTYVAAPGPFGRPSRPFYQVRGQTRLPLGTTYLYPQATSTKPGEVITKSTLPGNQPAVVTTHSWEHP